MTAGRSGVGTALTDLSPKLEARAAGFVREHRLAGAAVGVVHGDELAWSAGIGFADLGTSRAADTSTLYRIASITKTFTGTAIMQLRDDGLLHLDDPIVTYLPELAGAASPFGAIETVTLRRLLSHESGLMGDPPGTDWTGGTYEGDPRRTLARASEIGTRVPPNVQQKYSNLGYQLLGEVVTRVVGRPYADQVRDRILLPLGMAGTAFDPLGDALGARRATGYDARWLTDELDEAMAVPRIHAEGGLWSCVDDLARWISAQFGSNAELTPAGTDHVLATSTLHEMHTARYLGDDAWTEAWCISWYAARKDDVVWVQHAGGLPGFTTSICFDPKERVGAIVLLNGMADAAKLSMGLAGMTREAVRASVPTIDRPSPTPEAYRSLLGYYSIPAFGLMITVEWRDGRLALRDAEEPGWKPTLSPTDDPDVFTLDPGVRESGEVARFSRLPDGRVRAMFLADQTLARLDPVGD
jgi:D-alanyl-D-alanine carboxypeptidase